eukprot:4461011-Pyramimonas_sp.AAC.1
MIFISHQPPHCHHHLNHSSSSCVLKQRQGRPGRGAAPVSMRCGPWSLAQVRGTFDPPAPSGQWPPLPPAPAARPGAIGDQGVLFGPTGLDLPDRPRHV